MLNCWCIILQCTDIQNYLHRINGKIRGIKEVLYGLELRWLHNWIGSILCSAAWNIFILAAYIEEYYDSVWIFKPRLVSPAVRPAGLVHSLAAFTNWLVARRPLPAACAEGRVSTVSSVHLCSNTHTFSAVWTLSISSYQLFYLLTFLFPWY